MLKFYRWIVSHPFAHMPDVSSIYGYSTDWSISKTGFSNKVPILEISTKCLCESYFHKKIEQFRLFLFPIDLLHCSEWWNTAESYKNITLLQCCSYVMVMLLGGCIEVTEMLYGVCIKVVTKLFQGKSLVMNNNVVTTVQQRCHNVVIRLRKGDFFKPSYNLPVTFLQRCRKIVVKLFSNLNTTSQHRCYTIVAIKLFSNFHTTSQQRCYNVVIKVCCS